MSYSRRANRYKNKFGTDFIGSLRVCAKISAYADNDEPTHAILRLSTKALLFLGILQLNYQLGYLVMLGLLLFESSLDTVRVVLGYRNCHSLQQVDVTSQDEAHELHASTVLEPTNVYEDITRPRSIAIMVFLTQGSLIGMVMLDTFNTTTRTCFDGTDGCPMLSSQGSYYLYLLDVFMASVFLVGPMNSYGKKEQNPVFWLKLSLMSKESSSVVLWRDPTSDQTKTLELGQKDIRIWRRFVMSFLVNGVGFHFLLHALPIQIASKPAVMSVVYSAVGMIYLVDLDDTAGNTMTLVSSKSEDRSPDLEDGKLGGSPDKRAFDEQKQRIIDQAIKDFQAKLEALASGESMHAAEGLESVAHAIFLAKSAKRAIETEEESSKWTVKGEGTPLLYG